MVLMLVLQIAMTRLSVSGESETKALLGWKKAPAIFFAIKPQNDWNYFYRRCAVINFASNDVRQRAELLQGFIYCALAGYSGYSKRSGNDLEHSRFICHRCLFTAT